jgi:hypothetical protein
VRTPRPLPQKGQAQPDPLSRLVDESTSASGPPDDARSRGGDVTKTTGIAPAHPGPVRQARDQNLRLVPAHVAKPRADRLRREQDRTDHIRHLVRNGAGRDRAHQGPAAAGDPAVRELATAAYRGFGRRPRRPAGELSRAGRRSMGGRQGTRSAPSLARS